MPQRVELTELSAGYVRGVPFAVAVARDKRLVAFVGVDDSDGLLETKEDCLAACRMYLRRLDKNSMEPQE